MTEKTLNYFDRQFWASYAMRHEKVGPWQLPTVRPCYTVPKGVTGFDQLRPKTPRNLFVHWHSWDNEFETIWRNPQKHLRRLQEFPGIFMPDFSQFSDFDFPLCLWNLRRNRLLGNWYWENDVEVMPCATWWDEYSLEHCLDGLPKRSLIEVSNVNTCHTLESERIFEMGLNKVRDVLDPLAIILYGKRLKRPFDGPPILFFQNSHYTGNGCSYLNEEQLQLIKEA